MRTVATRTSWKLQPVTSNVIVLPFERTYSQADMEQIKFGLVPRQMEDKWFIYYEDSTLYFHRSWTGFFVYSIPFVHNENNSSSSILNVNNNKEEYNSQNPVFEIDFADFLINALLLNKRVGFPKPRNMTDAEAAFIHDVVGYARGNNEQ